MFILINLLIHVLLSIKMGFILILRQLYKIILSSLVKKKMVFKNNLYYWYLRLLLYFLLFIFQIFYIKYQLKRLFLSSWHLTLTLIIVIDKNNKIDIESDNLIKKLIKKLVKFRISK